MPQSAAAKQRTSATADFQGAFAELKRILERHANSLSVKEDKPDNYYLETVSQSFRGRPLMFAAVQRKKNYVSFHLMPVYMNAAMQKRISPGLKKRMQGKACFNFTWPDPQLFAELSVLVDAGLEGFRKQKLL